MFSLLLLSYLFLSFPIFSYFTMSSQTIPEIPNCGICLEKVVWPVLTKCQHMFCRMCLKKAHDISPKCPTCRIYLSESDHHEQTFVWEMWLKDKEYAKRCVDACLDMYKRTKMVKWLELVQHVDAHKVHDILGLRLYEEKKYKEALEHFLQMDPLPHNHIGDIYGFKLQPRNLDKAIEHFKKGAVYGGNRNDVSLALLYKAKGEYDQATAYCHKSIANGFTHGYHVLAMMEKDPKKKIAFFQKCATNAAKVELAKIYAFGRHGIERSYKKAMELCMNTQHEFGQYLMGKLYYHGLGVVQDYNQAWVYFHKSREYRVSKFMMGLMTYTGRGRDVDQKKGLDMIRAADTG